jgi:hypothetical protein
LFFRRAPRRKWTGFKVSGRHVVRANDSSVEERPAC